MIRRPVHNKLAGAVRAKIKQTTMREKAWPVGVPIMLYEWSGKPYRSKQVEVGVVAVSWVRDVWIHRLGDEMWEVEGFESQQEMNAWFRALVKPGKVLKRKLMRFVLVEERGVA